MITRWKLFNFKSIKEETDLAFGPLTILAGPNSSGKSTVLQSMLLISQTLSSRVRSRSVVLNGPLVKLGQFDDLRSHDGEGNQILIGWECNPQHIDTRLLATSGADPELSAYFGLEKDLKSVACDIFFEADPSDPHRDLLQLQPQLFGCTLAVDLKTPRIAGVGRLSINRSPDPEIKTRDYGIENVRSELRSMLEYDLSLESQMEREPWDDMASSKLVGCDMDHFLPNRLLIRFEGIEENADVITSALTDDTSLRRYRIRQRRYRNLVIPSAVIQVIREYLGARLHDLLFSQYGVQLSLFSDKGLPIDDLSKRMSQLKRQDRILIRSKLAENAEDLAQDIRQAMANDMGKKYELTPRPLTGELRAATVYLNRFFATQLRYLGPLRDEPKLLYPLATNVDPGEIGNRGEHTAAVFDLHKNNFVRYLPSARFEKTVVDTQPTTRTLETAVFDWLNYLGVAESLITRDRGKLGHELKVTMAGTRKPHDLTHVGVGVSQVLPILVMCLLAGPDTTLIIEQPELHLHPKVQTLLGDFFLSMALLGKQIIAETHSEYVINRLRFRAATAENDEIVNQLKIYFAEKQDGESHFREVNVNQYGAIVDWPEGFFDQSHNEVEKILRAGVEKKLQKRKNRLGSRNG